MGPIQRIMANTSLFRNMARRQGAQRGRQIYVLQIAVPRAAPYDADGLSAVEPQSDTCHVFVETSRRTGSLTPNRPTARSIKHQADEASDKQTNA